MASLIKKGTREVVEVAPGDVYKYLSSGEFNFPSELVSDGRLEMVSDSGEIVKVALGDVQDAFRHGYNLESGASRQGRELKKEYSGFLPGLTSAALGAAKGLTFGVSSAILDKMGVDVEMYEAFRPDEFVGGEVVGGIAGLMGTGPAGLAVRGGAKLAAKGAAGATAKMAEKTFGQRLMKKALAGSVEGAIDGALYGTGEAIHQIGLGKAELTGETLASTIGTGAGLGLVFGGGIGFASVPVMEGIRNYAAPAVKAIAKSMPVTLPTTITSAEGFFRRISKDAGYESLGPMLKDERLISKKWTDEEIDVAKAWLMDTKVVGEGGELVSPIQAGETWEEIAHKLGLKRDEVGQQLGEFTRRIEEVAPEGFGLDPEELLKRLKELRRERLKANPALSKGLQEAGFEAETTVKRIALANDLERNLMLDATYGTDRTLKRIEAYAENTGRNIDEIIAEAKRHREASKVPDDLDLDFGREKVAPEEILETEAAVGRLGEDLDDALGASRGLSPMEDLVADLKDDIYRMHPSEIDALYGKTKGIHKISTVNGHNTKRSYWDKSRFDRLAASEIPDYAKKVGAIWRDVLDESSDEIIQNWRRWGELGEDVIGDMDIDTFRRLKKEYGYADTFHTIAKDRAARSTVNSQTSMSGLLMTTAGTMMGLAGGGPWGGMVGATIGAATTKYLKENGTSLTHAGARFLSKLASVRNGKIDDIAKRASSVVKGTAKRTQEIGLPVSLKALTALSFTGAPPQGDTKAEVMLSLVDQIESVAGNPQMFATMVEAELQDLKVVAPLVAQETMKTKVRGMQFLSEKSPKRSGSYSNYQPKLYQKTEIDPLAMSQFGRYLTAVMDYTGTVFDDLADGTLMQETIEVGEKVYPEILREIRTVMAKGLAGEDKAYDNSFMANLNTLFGEGVVPYQSPDFMRRQQMQYKVESEGSMAGVKPSSAAQGPVALNTETAMEAVDSNLKRG
tara:strand:- start:5292 stop:8186 length:2895 start_codon:yes stop_codon:yes gene_type:complete